MHHLLRLAGISIESAWLSLFHGSIAIVDHQLFLLPTPNNLEDHMRKGCNDSNFIIVVTTISTTTLLDGLSMFHLADS